MDMPQYYAIFAGASAINFFAYFLIREIIWSIIWCERGKKHKSLRKIKAKYSWVQRLTQQAFVDCVVVHKKSFAFWIFMKRLHVGLFILLLSIGCAINNALWRSIYVYSFLGVSILFGICIVLQFDVNRQTKYDRIRRKK